VHTLHAALNEQRNLKLEERQVPLEKWIHGLSQPSSKFKLRVCTRCIYVTSFLAPCPDTCLGSSMSESGCENSATYRRWQSTSTNNRRRYFTTQIRNRIFLARNRVVLKSAGSGGVCAMSHFILVYTTVLTSRWVSEDMPFPTARQPVQNTYTTLLAVTEGHSHYIQSFNFIALWQSYVTHWNNLRIANFVYSLIFDWTMAFRKPTLLQPPGKDSTWSGGPLTYSYSQQLRISLRPTFCNAVLDYKLDDGRSSKQEDYVSQSNHINTTKTIWFFCNSPSNQLNKNCPTVVEPCSWKPVPGSYPQPLESTLYFLMVHLNVTLSTYILA
jgi:hypothetical protein